VFLDQPCASSSNSYVYQPSTISSAGHVVKEEDDETNKNGFFTCISSVFTSCF
jgi:hypothetical protein